MKNYLTILLASSLMLAMSCKEQDKTEPIEQPIPTGPSVETQPPNSNYKPAFTGQTRIGSVKTTTSYGKSVITSSLISPWGIAAMPDGRLLITEKAGRMRIVTSAGTIIDITSGIPAVNAGGQGGLLGLCLDPNFSTNRMIYWSFSEPGTGGTVTAIAKGRLATNELSLENTTVIFRGSPRYSGTNHYGGRVIFDKNGNLFASLGERSDDVIRVQAQSTNASIGKVIRITKDGQAVAGNPFIGQAGALPELYSIGHRNPQGLALHPVTGDIWQGEHGPRGGDEINRIQPGANYGWPIITYGLEYSGQPVAGGIQAQSGMMQPVYYWDPIIAPSGMTFYTGNRIPEWQNNLFISALAGMHIARLTFKDNVVTGEERLLTDVNQRFRDITQGADGALYAITDQGRLYRIDRN